MVDRIRAVILCEDRQQEVFARTFLKECGIAPIRVQVCPNGQGAGEQYVRENFPTEVRLFRAHFHAQPNTRLVALTDADELSVIERLRFLDRKLEEDGLQERSPDEPIGVFIPKRNIETWIHYLQGEEVNEGTVYRHLNHEGDCRPVVQNLARNRHHLPDRDTPPSLMLACNELERII